MTTAAIAHMAESEVVRPRRDPVLIGLWIALLLVALIWIAPFVFIVFTSLKIQPGGDGEQRFRAAGRVRVAELRARLGAWRLRHNVRSTAPSSP